MGLSTTTQTAFIATAVIILGTLAYRKWKKPPTVKIPSNWEEVGTVRKLHMYPLKSGHRIEMQRGEITRLGLKQMKEDGKGYELLDRVLVTYGDDAEFRTARTFPKMVFIEVSVRDEQHLALDAPGMNTLYVKIPQRGANKVVRIKYWRNEYVKVLDCGDEVASWLSRYIIEKDSGLRLGFYDYSQKRDISKTDEKHVTYYENYSNASLGLFNDFTSVTLVGQPSVNDLNERMIAASMKPVTAEHFRHNMVIDGSGMVPCEENDWDFVKIGETVVLRNVKDGTRCIVPNISPESGILDTKQCVIKTLKSYRPNCDGPDAGRPRFAIHLEVHKTGVVQVGDRVYVVRKEKKTQRFL